MVDVVNGGSESMFSSGSSMGLKIRGKNNLMSICRGIQKGVGLKVPYERRKGSKYRKWDLRVDGCKMVLEGI